MKKRFAKIITATLLTASAIGFASCSVNGNEEPVKNNEPLNVDIIKDFGAKGDGKTSDRAAIQKAIDYVSLNGGGTVTLTSGHTFLSGNLMMRSNVTLYIGDNSTLLQNPDVNDYVEVRGYDYGNGFVKIGEPYVPYTDDVVLDKKTANEFYKNIWPGINDWLEMWHWNYPFFHADKGVHDIKITGGTNSEVRMAEHGDTCKGKIHMNVIGFYRVTNYEISNLTFNYSSNHLMDYICCNNGLIKNINCHTKRSVGISECRMNDGIHVDRCQDLLIKDCFFASGDDSCLIGNHYGDIRRDRWASGFDAQPMERIELDNVTCPSLCSGFSWVSCAGTCPNLGDIEIRDIYVHDCHFAGAKIWGQNTVWLPDESMWNGVATPMSNIRWERNDSHYAPEGYVHQISEWGAWPVEFMSDVVCDGGEYKSMTSVANGDFYHKKAYWNFKTNNGSISTVESYDDKSYGFIGNLDKGESRIYEGLYLEAGSYKMACKVRNAPGAKVFLYVADQQDHIVAKKEVNSTEWEGATLTFDIEEAKNYRLGLMSGDECLPNTWAMLDDFTLVKVA